MHFIIFQTHTHTHQHAHTPTLWSASLPRGCPCGWQQQLQPTHQCNHTFQSTTHKHLSSPSLSLMYTYTYTDSHPPAPPASLMVLLLYTGPLPYLALTHGATTLYFQHPIHIQQPPTSSLFLGHLTPDLLPINWCYLTASLSSSSAALHKPSAQPPIPAFTECDRRTASWLGSTTYRIKKYLPHKYA